MLTACDDSVCVSSTEHHLVESTVVQCQYFIRISTAVWTLIPLSLASWSYYVISTFMLTERDNPDARNILHWLIPESIIMSKHIKLSDISYQLPPGVSLRTIPIPQSHCTIILCHQCSQCIYASVCIQYPTVCII